MNNRIKSRVITLIIAQFFLVTTVAVAQQNEGTKSKDRAEDVFREMEEGELTLRFINALTGDYVQGADVTIGGNPYTTDHEGRVFFKANIEDGLVAVTFKKEGFITSEFDIEIMLGSVWQNRISVSPDMRPESIRIVLDWNRRPRDLDAHLIKEGGYHISYRNKLASEDGAAQLDRDDTNGEGPETITINRVDREGIYRYVVHNFSDSGNSRSKDLSNRSRATVRIYGDNRLMETHRITEDRRGTKWTVFQIRDGNLEVVNTVE